MGNETHSLDKGKVEARLLDFGWRRGQYGEWIYPNHKTRTELEEEWIEAILNGIVCKHEEQIKENREYIAKHRTPERPDQ